MVEQEKKSKILIVDDDPMNILILEEMLGDKYDYRVASSEPEAVMVCEEFKSAESLNRMKSLNSQRLFLFPQKLF
jgi:PleD family two-component response regulator